MMDFIVEYFYSLMYVIGLTVVIFTAFSINKIKFWKIILFVMIYGFIVNVVTYTIASMGIAFIISNIICMIIDCIYCGILINRFKLNNLLVTALYYNLFILLSGLLTSCLMLIKDASYIEISMGNYRCLIVIILNISTLLFVYFIFRDKKEICNAFSKKYVIVFVLINFLEEILILMLGVLMTKAKTYEIYIVILMAIVFLILLIIDYLVISFADIMIEKGRLEMMEYSYSIMKHQVDEMDKEQAQVMKVKHDIKNHLTILNGIIDENSLQAKVYLESITNEVNDTLKYIDTGNAVIDTILNLKVNNNPDINFDTNILIRKEINIPESKLCALLFNLIDNAVEAARNTKEKNVAIKIINKEDMLLIEITNSVSEEPNFISGKGKGHGYGIKIIKEIASSFDGKVNYRYENNILKCTVLINE